ncbi:phosphoadenosine phosphosulfate reductase [Mucilaginibacter terrae]|uniref:Phosphoadenosine phosphosulfate reductase n=1 Tax=Mucilaginibacter terrae TaxID=1955052 RepID=A0ABU3GY90_9SPHI|nr:phosphoadenosine phosphosulfate reductase [Mucilaginibacter terrae]
MNSIVQHIKEHTLGLSPVEALAWLADAFPGKVVFSTSFGWEDQVISHMIFANNLPIKVFTLETGRLFPETYYVWNRTMEMYEKPIHAYYPQHEALEQMVNAKGPSSFYESVENRKECCGIRKIEPLKRALAGSQCWITGIRAEQSANRLDMDNVEWDEGNQLAKFHPIFDWTLDEVKSYIKNNNIPPTIPCTTVVSRALAVPPARAPYNRAKISGPAAGGGKTNRKKNVVCMQ